MAPFVYLIQRLDDRVHITQKITTPESIKFENTTLRTMSRGIRAGEVVISQ